MYSTAPPKHTGSTAVKASVIHAVSKIVMPLATRVASHHFGGETLKEAIEVAEDWARKGYASTLGYWDVADTSRDEIAKAYADTIAYLKANPHDCYMSIKPPALRFDPAIASDLAASAKEANVRLHCDSHAVDMVEKSHAMLDAMIERCGFDLLGCTIPGRWQQSLNDADWAIERQVRVRVVKGQWPDPSDPQHDIHDGYMKVIERLAGRAKHVAVATHDLPLATKAVERLRAAGTSVEMEQLLGLAASKAMKWAKDNHVPVRVYVPFGKGYIPNAIGVLRRNPHLIMQTALSFFTSA